MPKHPLTREVVLQAALDLVDRDGLGALTMRHLATELEVATMSIYTYVPTKDDLVIGVLNLAVAEMAVPPPDTPPWDAFRAVIREFRRVAHRHPNLVPLTMTRPPSGVSSLRTLEASLDALRRTGLDPEATACAYRMTASFAIGFVSLESGGYFKPLEEGQPVDVDLAALADMPRVIEMGPHLASWDSDAEFESGLEVLIAALQRSIPEG